MGDFHFNAGAAWHEGSFLDESSDYAKSVMEGTVSFVEDQLVGTSEEDGNSLVCGWAACDLDNFSSATGTNLFDETGMSELIGVELVNMSNWGAIDGLADEIDVISIDILDNHNLLLGEEMKSKVTDGLSKDTLLEEKNVGA